VGDVIRIAPTIVLEVLLAVALSLLLLTAWQTLLSGDLLEGFGSAAYLLFFFNDVAMLVWLAFVIILAVRRRSVPGVGITIAAALFGVVVNLIMVSAIGFAQQGWFAFYVLFAIEAGAVFLVAVLVVTPIVQRLTA
jgi:hypothetical protein